MEILAERTREGKERNALTIRSIHSCYEIVVDSEPTIGFIWDIAEDRWVYNPMRVYPYTSIILEPIEILVRLPIDDTLKVTHHPYLTDLTNAELAIRMERLVGKMALMLTKLSPPKCLDSLKLAMAENKKRKNQYSMEQTNLLYTS